MNEKVTLCNSMQDAENIIKQCPYTFHRLQQYIPPTSGRLTKTRVLAKLSHQPKFFAISKKFTSTQIVESEPV